MGVLPQVLPTGDAALRLAATVPMADPRLDAALGEKVPSCYRVNAGRCAESRE
ncbi:MAG: hypothetical protein ACRDPW_02275 [Mycobacteriales bacterium]